MRQVHLPKVTSLEDYSPYFNQHELWIPAMQAICEQVKLTFNELVRIPEGSAIVFANQDYILKLLPPFWGPELDLDCLGLARAQGKLSVRTPELIATGELEDWRYLITRKIPGQSIQYLWPQLDVKSRQDILFQLGHLMAELHRLNAEQIPVIWDDYVHRHLNQFIAQQVNSGLTTQQAEIFAQELHRLLAKYTDQPRNLFLHCDLTDQHLFVEQIKGKCQLTGLLDFGDLMAGPAYYEFAAPCILLTPHSPALRQILVNAYGAAIQAEHILLAILIHRYTNLSWMFKQEQLEISLDALYDCYCKLN